MDQYRYFGGRRARRSGCFRRAEQGNAGGVPPGSSRTAANHDRRARPWRRSWRDGGDHRNHASQHLAEPVVRDGLRPAGRASGVAFLLRGRGRALASARSSDPASLVMGRAGASRAFCPPASCFSRGHGLLARQDRRAFVLCAGAVLFRARRHAQGASAWRRRDGAGSDPLHAVVPARDLRGLRAAAARA